MKQQLSDIGQAAQRKWFLRKETNKMEPMVAIAYTWKDQFLRSHKSFILFMSFCLLISVLFFNESHGMVFIILFI